MTLLEAIIKIGQEQNIKEAHLYHVTLFTYSNITHGATFKSNEAKQVFLDFTAFCVDQIPVVILEKLIADNTFYAKIKELKISRKECENFLKYPKLVDLILSKAELNYNNDEQDGYAQIYGNYLNQTNRQSKLEQLIKVVI